MHRTICDNDALEPIRTIDLASALGAGVEEATLAGRIATIGMCTGVLQRHAYWSFLDDQGFPGRHVHEAHPQAVAFLAHLDGRPVGAAALIPDSPLGLPLPEAFQPTIARLRRDGRQMALLDPLVIPAELDARAAGLFMRALLRLAILTARRLDGRSDILVRCEPRFARFFAQVLLFTTDAEEPSAANGAPAQILLRLDLDLCPGEWLRLYGDGAWSPYGLHIRPSPQATRVIEWLRRHRQPPSFHELVTTWIDPRDGSPPLDYDSFHRLRRLYPGLAEHLAIHHADPDGARPARAAGTGPIPRIRTPLPWREDIAGSP
ncbi:MAG: hypothetical protein J0M02_05195 [Planctomycetes bacterium]|nr:hypothetical protein [Planctomycetota bacterium]